AGSTSTSSSATFTYSGTDNLAPVASLNYSTQLDANGFIGFSSATSASYTNLADGSHTFQVKAQDLAGNQDATPASRTWTVHAQAPVVNLTGGPGEGGATGAAVTFAWSSTLSPVATSVTYAYSLDGGAFSAESATPTASFTGLTEGSHAFQVR